MERRSNTGFAKALRSASSDAERKLWQFLRNRQLEGWKFRRQVTLGPYILDFACLETGLVVELDGGQHLGRVAYDRARTTWLESNGYRVLRFWNDDVLLRTPDVLEHILRCLPHDDPHPDPLPPAGEGE